MIVTKATYNQFDFIYTNTNKEIEPNIAYYRQDFRKANNLIITCRLSLKLFRNTSFFNNVGQNNYNCYNRSSYRHLVVLVALVSMLCEWTEMRMEWFPANYALLPQSFRSGHTWNCFVQNSTSCWDKFKLEYCPNMRFSMKIMDNIIVI